MEHNSEACSKARVLDATVQQTVTLVLIVLRRFSCPEEI